MKFNDLSIQEKAAVIKLGVGGGLRSLLEIRLFWDSMPDDPPGYYEQMEKVANENYHKWGYDNQDEALVHALNDNTYDYRGFYRDNPNAENNAETHWPDTYKTVYHPTFSNESKYKGRVGGRWDGDNFIPAKWLNKYAAGGNMRPDWDPNNPYHYHTANGEKVVITPEDWEKHKGLPYFKQVENAVLTEQAAHPGPEYIINPKFSEDLRRVYKGNMGPKYQNYSSFSSNLPQGYSFTPEGLVSDNQGNLYVLKGFRLTPRFTYDENSPLVFPVLEGRNQGNVTFYPVNMEKTIKPALPVNSILDIDKEIYKVQNMYPDIEYYPMKIKDLLAFDEDSNTYLQYGNNMNDFNQSMVGGTHHGYWGDNAWNNFVYYLNDALGKVKIDMDEPIDWGDENVNLNKKQFDIARSKLIEFHDNTNDTRIKRYIENMPLFNTPNSFKIQTKSRKKDRDNAVIEVGPLQVNNVLTYAKGGLIHIKPENRGKFTALKKRTGHSATWFKKHGTPALRKMATFALNARKWHKHDIGGPLDDNPPIDENGMYYGQYYPEQWDMLSNLRKEQVIQLYNLLNNNNTPYIVQLILNDIAFANSNEGLLLINTAKLDRLNKLAEQQQLQLEILEYASKHGPIAADVKYNGPISSAMKDVGNYMVNHTKNAFTHPWQTFKEDLPELLYYIPGWGQGTLAHDVKEELLNDNVAGALLSSAFLVLPALRKFKNQITLPFRNAKDVLNGNMARALTDRSYVILDIGDNYNRTADLLNKYIARANITDPSDYYGRKLLDANNLDILVTRKFEQGPRLPLVDENGNYNYNINKGRQGLMTLPNGEVISNPLYIEYPSGNQEQVNLSYGINKGLFYDPYNHIFRYKGEKYAMPDIFSKFIYPEQEVPMSFIEQYMNKELPKQSNVFSKTFNDYVKGIESRIGDNGILVGSTRLILQGLVGGVPGDIEVLTTKGRLQDVKNKFDFHYLRDTKNGTGIHGTSPYVHTSNTSYGQNPMDINIILTDKDGNAIGIETYEIARALFGEDYVNGVLMRNADKNAKVSIGNPLSNEQVGVMLPIPRLNGKGFYSDEEIFLLFKDSGKVTEKLLTDTFGSYNVKHSDRAIALLTSTNKENIKLVETALDHIGKQLGSGYQSLSSRYPNIDFGNYDENIKFLLNIGLKNNIHAIASNPDAMRNIANKYYIEKTAAVRSLNYDRTKKGTLQQVMAPGISLDNGSSAGGGGNTVLNSLFGGFLRGFTGAMQFHPTYHPENVNTLNDVFNLINRQETIFNTPEASKIVQDIFNKHGIRFELNMMNRALFTDQLSVLVQDGSMTLLQAGEITLEISEALDVAGFMGEPYGGIGTYFGSLQTKGMPMTYRNAEYHSSNGGSEMIGGYEFGNTISNAHKDSDADLIKKIKKMDINPYYLRYNPQYTDVQSEQLDHMLYIPDDVLYKTPESELQAREMSKYFDDKAGEYYNRAKNIREKAANLNEFRSKLSDAILPIGSGIGGIGLIVSGCALGVEIMDDNRLENDAYRNNSTPIELLNERIESTQDRYYGYKNDYDSLSDEEFLKKYGYDKEKFNEFMDFDLSKNMTEFSNDLANWAYKLRKKRQYKEYSKMSNEEWQEKTKKIKKRVEKSEQRLKERQQRAEERYKNKKALGGLIKPFSYLPIPEVRY